VIEVITEPKGRLHVGPPKTRAARRTVGLPQFVLEALVGLCQVGARDLLGRPSQRGAGRRQRGQAPAQQASRT
jgi:hypothetical protein